MKKILCFGDSNTWGHDPADCSRLQKRWPVLLKELLPDCQITEDGVCGRSTRYDVPDMKDSNGLHTFREKYLKGQPSFDLILLMLGTNDLLRFFGCSPEEIAQSLRDYITECRGLWGKSMPQILLVSPVLIRKTVLQHPVFSGLYDMQSVNSSGQVAGRIKQVAEEEQVYFMDASKASEPSALDGIHMDAAGHQKLAEAIVKKIKEIL